MRQALLIAGGTLNLTYAEGYIKEKKFDCIIAIDNGLKYADELGLKPTIIVGDFDTAQKSLVDRYSQDTSITVVRLIPEKDATDTETAVDYAIRMKYDEIIFLGAMGGRFDHTLANLHMLYRLSVHDIPGYLLDDKNRVRILTHSIQLHKDELLGTYVSILPFDRPVEKLTLKGFKYPLWEYTLLPGTSIGISNEVVEEICEISFEKGILILIEAHD